MPTGIGLVAMKAIDIDCRHIDVIGGVMFFDPTSQQETHTTTSEYSNRIESCCYKVIAKFRRFAYHGIVVGCERLGPTEQGFDAIVVNNWYSAHGILQIWHHALPIWFNLTKTKVLWYPLWLPGGTVTFKQAQHEPIAFGSNVHAFASILYNRPGHVNSRNGICNKIVAA